MAVLVLIPYWLLPAAAALVLVLWLGAHLPFRPKANRLVLALLAGLAVAPVGATDGHGVAIVPLWLYLLWVDLHGATVLQVAVSWAVAAVVFVLIFTRIDSRRWSP